MSKTLLRSLALTVSAMSLGAVTAHAQTRGAPTRGPDLPADTEVFETYRLETNDCPGCGATDIQVRQDLVDILENMEAFLAAAATTPPPPPPPTNPTSQMMADLGTQVVFLDFDAGGLPFFPVCFTNGPLFGVFNDHIYSQAERDEIQARIEHDYRAFNYVFTQTAPTFGDFSTISIGENDAPLDCSQGSNISLGPGLSVLFGRADEIDFGNRNPNNTAFADASVWPFLAQLGGGVNFEPFSNLDVANDFGGDLQAAVDFAVEGQTANTGAHELGHTVGLRHQNSFGAPGDGIPNTGAISPFDFVPVFGGPANAAESILHTMASGASVGLSFDGGVNTDRFFSERSATRLTVNQDAARITRREGWNRNRLPLRQIFVPNTIEDGVNEGARIDVNAAIVQGRISAFGETDSFTFFSPQGEFLNVELLPVFSLGQTFEEGIIGQLRVYQINRDGTEVLIGQNIQSFESLFDTEIFDLELPARGYYRVEVSAPDEIFFGGGGSTPAVLSEVGGADLLVGDYEFLIFRSNIRMGEFNRQELDGENRADWLNRDRQGQTRAPG